MISSDKAYQNELTELLAKIKEPIVKSKFLRLAKSKHWHGYKSSSFVTNSKEIDRAFAHLIHTGVIIFERGKPLKWGETK